jgi:hypothetical protein
VPSTFGTQPIRDVLRQQGRTIPGTARAAGVDLGELARSVQGRCRPSAGVLATIPTFLGAPAERLFTKRALAYPHKPHRRVPS